MVYNVEDLNIKEEDLDFYLDNLINKIFAILGIYEDCESKGDFFDYNVYLDRILTELCGFYHIIESNSFISIYNILTGIKYENNINHKKVKSLVFHCISIIKKTKSRNGDKNELL